ncbi:sialate O-acetylesterase-like isoform X1 [Conger conger]|uniref:sialate O-acetylesterase-like isoform X1 n=2 Tax=Conger conger TaxID=82655 RepID=UPI002A5A6BC5|nr:sialate O-acetylesterase-like isoform X1 [Conger conger]
MLIPWTRVGQISLYSPSQRLIVGFDGRITATKLISRSSSTTPCPTALSKRGAGGADVRFASYYGDHMVLQQAPARAVLWGYGSDQYKVSVILQGTNLYHAADVYVQNGVWRVTLPPTKAGGPYSVNVSQQGSQVTLTDLMFGDVWMCGGQSNMRFSVSEEFNGSAEMALAPQYPDVRIFMAASNLSKEELMDLPKVRMPWSVPTAERVGHFSAVCWLFGRYLYQVLGYPVGLVDSSYGGTPVEAWSSPQALHKCGLEKQEEVYSSDSNFSRDDVGPAKRNNSVLWNAMIHPFLNMTIKGVIWYQGESNTWYHLEKYSCSFPAMIDDWRAAFHLGSGGQTAPDFPFGFVQLCTRNKTEDGFPVLRWHQTADYGFAPNPRMNNTFMAVALDLPDEKSPWGSIHPRFKQDVAYRLTLGARAVAYGEKGVSFQGPFPDSVQLIGDSINITYNQPVSVTPTKSVFEICCTEEKKPCNGSSKWLPAPTMQWGERYVQVSVSRCESVVSGLRYAWSDWPCEFKACPVYSADRGLPAPPFTLNTLP